MRSESVEVVGAFIHDSTPNAVSSADQPSATSHADAQQSAGDQRLAKEN